MTNLHITGSGSSTIIDKEDLLSYLHQFTKIKTQKPSTHTKYRSDMIWDINKLHHYFVSPKGGGYELYQSITSTIHDSLIQILKSLSSEELQFLSPYTRKELSFLWIGYNMISEIAEWLSNQVRQQKSISRNFIAFSLDWFSIFTALKMRELVEDEIYGKELNDREKWGFLLKDYDKQIISQLMLVLVDVSAILNNTILSSETTIPDTMQLIGKLGGTKYNLIFIRQAINGLIKYGNTSESEGWLAWLIQELGFLQDNEYLEETIPNLPIPFDLVLDVIMVIKMGQTLFR